MSSSAIYLRVSKEDLDESKQLTAIQESFNIDDPIIFREKLSAYTEIAQEKRTNFQELKKGIMNNEINKVYIFSVERLERNIIRLFEFYFFCEAHNCEIHSVQQDIPNKIDNEKPIQTFLRYVNVLLFGYKGQEESYTISYRTKSARDKKVKHNTFSVNGNKWGKQFKDLEGNNVEINQNKLKEIQSFILSLIKKQETNNKKGYYPFIIKKVEEKYKIKISKAYLSVLKNGRARK